MGVRGVVIDPCVIRSLIANLRNLNRSFQTKRDCKNHFTSNHTIIVVLTNYLKLVLLKQVRLNLSLSEQSRSNFKQVKLPQSG